MDVCGGGRSDLSLLPSYFTVASSLLSMLGALSVLGQWMLVRRMRRARTRSIVTMLAVAELVTSSSYIVAGINFIANFSKGDGNQCENVCKIQCFVTTWFSMSGNIWTGILMIELALILHPQLYWLSIINKNRMPFHNFIAFIFPLVIVMPLLVTGDLECSNSLMHHPTAVSIVVSIIAGPFWVILTFVVITISYILIVRVRHHRETGVSLSTDHHIVFSCEYEETCV